MIRTVTAWFVGAALCVAQLTPPPAVSLSPRDWPAGEYDKFVQAQANVRTEAGLATGRKGAVTVEEARLIKAGDITE